MAERTATNLSGLSRLRAWGRLGVLELRRATGGRWVYLVAGCLVWFVIVALWSGLAADRPFEGTTVQNGVMALPLVLLAFFLGSQAVAADQENRSLEVVLSMPRGGAGLWILRLWVAAVFIGLVSLVLAILSWFFVAAFPFWGVWFQTMVSVAFFLAFSFLFSVLLRSGTAAALVSSLFMGAVFLTNPIWKQGALSYVYPFINPYLEPDGVRPEVWEQTVLANRVGLSITVALMVLGGLVVMRKRERLL